MTYTIEESRDVALDRIAIPSLREAAELLEEQPLTDTTRVQVSDLIVSALYAIGQAYEKQAVLNGDHPGFSS